MVLYLQVFPWNLISFSFSNNIYFIQVLSVIGTYTFNLICISLFTVPAIFVLRKSRNEITVCFFFIFISTIFLIFGNLKDSNFYDLKSVKNSYKIRAISPNISLDRFYSKQGELQIINELITLSNPKKNEPTIFIWPEGIIPDTDLVDLGMYKDLFSNSFGENDFIIMGINNVETEDGDNSFFNTMAVFDNNLNLIQNYNKINLVPFGEFIPLESILSYVGLKTITNEYQSFSSGKSRKPLVIKNNKIDLSLLPLICYEIIYSGRLSDNENFDYIIKHLRRWLVWKFHWT